MEALKRGIASVGLTTAALLSVVFTVVFAPVLFLAGVVLLAVETY